MWTIATLVQVISPRHVVPVSVNVVMGSVASAFFGGALISSRRGNGNGNGDKEKK